MMSRGEIAGPLENRKYRICYFCADDLNGNQTFLECGHPFCTKCLSCLKGSSDFDTHDGYQQLQKLFRIARATMKTDSSNNQVDSVVPARNQSESHLTGLSRLSERSEERNMGNTEGQALIKCPVCLKASRLSYRDHNEAPVGDRESANDSSPMERDVLRCDCCSHKGRNHDDQTVAAEFYCQKCSLNFCNKCRGVHDETPLFREHTVLPVTSKSSGVERSCRRHNNMPCSYFCIHCRSPLCPLCVLFHQRDSSKSSDKSATSRPKSSQELNCQPAHHRTAEPHRFNERQNQEARPMEWIRESENHALLRSVVSDDAFQFLPKSREEVHDGHKIVKFREALTMVREGLKSSLNQLGPRLDALKEKLRSFCFLPVEYAPNLLQSDVACSSSSSTSTLSPPVELENFYAVKRQNSIKKRHFSTGEKNVMIRLLRPKSGEKEKDPEFRTGRFRLSKSKKLPLFNQGGHSQGGQTPVKVDAASTNEHCSDGSDENSWSSDTSTNRLKLFRSFRKKFQTSGNFKNSPMNSDQRKPNESEVSPIAFSVAHAPQGTGMKRLPRKMSDSRGVCVDINPLSEQEREFIESTKMLVSKYIKLFEVATKALESSQSKKLYDFYENLSRRIGVILDEELSLLEPEISKRTQQRRERMKMVGNRSSENLRRLACRQESGIASLALASTGLFESLSGWTNLSQKLKVRGEGQTEIWASGRTILARPFQRWKYERTKSDLENSSVPCAATLADEGRVAVVAEYDNNNIRNSRLQILDGSTGRYLDSIMEGQIQPLGVAVTRDQHLVVSDCKGKRVKIISLETKATIAEMGKGIFGWPCGVAVNSRGQIVVSDVFNDCIFVFSSDGKKLKTFGSSGGSHEKLRNPYHLAVDSSDRIFVSDSSNGCIKVFDASGNLQFTSNEMVRHHSLVQDGVGERKGATRKLRSPRGVTVDEAGNFYVADDQSKVCMFDSGGKFCRFLLTEEDSLRSPESLSYCGAKQDGLLLLTEWSPSNVYAVKMFSLYQNM